MSMKAYGYSKYGDAAVGTVMSVAVPDVKDAVGKGPVYRIKVHAASFNPIDYKRRGGAMKMIMPEKIWPVILGYDAAGVIDQVGEGATKFKVGDEVYVRIGSEFPAQGTCAEYTLAGEKYVSYKPKNFSHEEAAAVPLAALTALQMLRKANFKSGDQVFVNGAAGGVGHYAVQIAKGLGASKVVGSASSAKHGLLKELGCDEVIDYKSQNYAEMYAATRPFDIGIDTVGEVVKLTKVVKEGGSVISIVEGINSETFIDAGIGNPGFLLNTIFYFMRWSVDSAVSAAKVRFFSIFLRPNAEQLDELRELIEAGKMKSIITGNVYEGIDKAPDAMAALESGRTTGKVVVKIV